MTRMICQGLTGQAWQLTSGGSRQKNFEKVNIIISILAPGVSDNQEQAATEKLLSRSSVGSSS